MRFARILSMMVALLALATAGCAAFPSAPEGSDAASLSELARERLGPLPGVETVVASQSPLDIDADESQLDRWNPELWSVSVVVSMLEDAPEAEIAAAAEAASGFSAEYAGEGEWSTLVSAGRTILGDDVAPRRSVEFAVFPTYPSPGPSSPGELATAVLDVAGIAGVDSIIVFRGRPFVTVLEASALDAVYDRASGLALFVDGGDYATADGRLRITEVPGQLTPAAVHAIVALAAAYPVAPVALTASLDGPSGPALFIDKVTAGEAEAIAATLSDPALAGANRGDFVIPFAIRFDGSGDLSGTFGGVSPG